MTDTIKNLYYLDELPGYKVAKNYSDVRGWYVKDVNGRIIGTVDHLLVNKIAERVVYLDVEVDKDLIEQGHDAYQKSVADGVHGFINKDGDNHLIIPIGMASIDDEIKVVITNEIDSSTFAKAKRFRKGDFIDFEYELNTLRHYRGDNNIHSSYLSEGFYDREEFDKNFHSKM